MATHRLSDRAMTYGLILTFIATVAIGVNGVLYTNAQARRTQRVAAANTALQLQALCGFVVVIDDAYTTTPPPASVPAAVRFAAEIHHLRQALHCDQHSALAPSSTPSSSSRSSDSSTPSGVPGVSGTVAPSRR